MKPTAKILTAADRLIIELRKREEDVGSGAHESIARALARKGPKKRQALSKILEGVAEFRGVDVETVVRSKGHLDGLAMAAQTILSKLG